MEDLKKVGQFRVVRDGVQAPEVHQARQCGGLETLVESGEVYSVEPGGEVGGQRGGTMVGVEGDRRTSYAAYCGRSMFKL